MNQAAIIDSIGADLGDDLADAGSHKIPVVTCTIESVLQPEDIAEYCAAVGNLPAVKSDEKDLRTLRARHQSIARMLAAGLPEGVVAELNHMTPSHLSTLKNSPSMIELIAHYRAPGNQAIENMAEKLRLLADMSAEQLIAKAERGELNANELLAAAKLGADRSGNGPMSKVDVTNTHVLDEEFVQKLAQTARQANQNRIIDVSAVRRSLPGPEGDSADS